MQYFKTSAASRAMTRALAAAAAFLAAAQANAENAPDASDGGPPPNIVLILADDLGFNQVGAYGDTPIRTPNIDRLAAEGVRFTHAYCGGPVCSPSRVSLLTGRDARLLGDLTNEVRLEPSDVTLPRVLKDASYDTALFGKHSIGDQMGATDPLAIGFDTWMGMFLINEGHRQYPTFLWQDGALLRLRENEGRKRKTYAQERFAEAAIRYVQQPHDNPFFVMLAFSSPHAELAVPPEYSAPYEKELPKKPYPGQQGGGAVDRYARYYPDAVDHPHAVLAGMVTALDAYVGRVLESLEQAGVAENTLVLFTSDNGPHEEGGADPAFFRAAAPYRGVKRDLYDGGIHVPMIARWPARITRPRVDDTPWAFADVLPTLAEVAGVDLTTVPQLKTNGASVAARLRDDPAGIAERTLYWAYTEQVGDPNSGVRGSTRQAARRGPWKAVRNGRDSAVELYRLLNDPSESNNLALSERAVADGFRLLFDEHIPPP